MRRTDYDDTLQQHSHYASAHKIHITHTLAFNKTSNSNVCEFIIY